MINADNGRCEEQVFIRGKITKTMRVSVSGIGRKILICALLTGVLTICLSFFSSQAKATVGINPQFNFQGRLLNSQGAVVPDGYYNIQFKIYQDGDGQSVGDTTGSPAGSLKWTETYLNANGKGVLVKNGLMSVELGSVTPFGTSVDWNQSTLWLSINVGNTNNACTPFANCVPDGEMVPMKRLSSTPYALNAGQLGGMTSAQFLQLAQGVQTDATTNTSSIFVNKTGSGNLLQLQSNSSDVFQLSQAGDITMGANANHTITIATTSAGIAGKNLTIAAGTTTNTGNGAVGGNLVLQGGNAAGTGNNNGGNVTISGGAGTGSGAKGLVNLSASVYIPNTNVACAADCTITQSNVDNFGTVVVSASTTDILMTLPAPSNQSAAGRILYVTSDDASQDFTLTTNAGLNQINVAMRKNTTATMIWNGTQWTAGGASNATTLQAAYANGSNPDSTPEIKLDTIRGTIDIQDADVSIGQDLFNIHSSNSGGLGTVLFGVANTGRVTIQGTTDLYSAFRVLRSNGDYLFNINSSNNYVFSNGITTVGNDITNQGFETGGSLTGGEEGWFGSSQASIVNDPANAHTGNYEMQVIPNGTNLDIYAGNYREVKPGDSIYFEGYLKNSAGTNGTAGIEITWYDQNKSILSYSTAFPNLPGTNYVLRSISATAPANASYARVSATVRSDSGFGLFYFDDFYLKDNSERAPVTFQNGSDSTTAFRIQSANAADTLFTADTTNNILKVGNSTGSDTATTILVVDSTTTDPTSGLASRNGGLFYRSDTGSLKAIISGAVVDVCTTAVTCPGYSASAGNAVQLQASSPGTQQTGNFNISGTGMLTRLQTQDMASGSSQNLVIKTGNTGNGISGNLTLDVGTATSSLGNITIGHTGVATNMAGTLNIQGSNSLKLGSASTNAGSILFYTDQGSHTVSLAAPSVDPTSSYTLTLPQAIGSAGDCLKDTGGGVLGFSGCGIGLTTNLQNVYDNSSPAQILLANAKDITITSQQAATPGNILFDLQCNSGAACGANGRFAVQQSGTDVFTIQPNGGGLILNGNTQIGSGTTDATQVNFQLDSYNGATDSGACSTTVNQGALYYNTSMGSIRGCVNGSWVDISNPDTLGLLTFGIVPSSGGGNNAYDLPSLIIPGASGPCKVSWASNNSVSIQACTAYSSGRRVNVAATTLYTNVATTGNANLTTAARWGHICLTGSNNQPAFTSTAGQATALTAMPTFSPSQPILCLADVQGSATTNGQIAQIYDVRTFTSTQKEAVNFATAGELGMLMDSSVNGGLVPSASCTTGTCSGKLYGVVVATDGLTSAGAPNSIVATIGPSYVKATSGTAGQFIKSGSTVGYAQTVTAIPNNAFYYSAGNTRTNWANTCTSASTCTGSLYVNFVVR